MIFNRSQVDGGPTFGLHLAYIYSSGPQLWSKSLRYKVRSPWVSGIRGGWAPVLHMSKLLTSRDSSLGQFAIGKRNSDRDMDYQQSSPIRFRRRPRNATSDRTQSRLTLTRRAVPLLTNGHRRKRSRARI